MLCKRRICRHAVSVCPSVCLSVTFVNSVKTSDRIFKFFSSSGSHIILVFSIPSAMAIFRLRPSNRGVECRWVGKKRDSRWISRFIACCQRCDGQVLSTRCRWTDRGKLLHLSLAVSGGVCWWPETTQALFLKPVCVIYFGRSVPDQTRRGYDAPQTHSSDWKVV